MRPATLTIAPDPRDFGQAPLSTPKASSVVLSNSGDLDTLTPSVNVAAPFSTTGGCGSAIAGGSSCTLNLQFSPTAGGRFDKDLHVRAGTLRPTAKLTGVGWSATTAPHIAGSPSVGYKTSVATGGWPGQVASFSFQWERCETDGTSCSDIGGATHAGYRSVLADEGHTLRVRLTATSTQAVTSDPVETAPSDVVTRTVPTLTDAPKIKRSSSPAAGTTLHAYRGQWTGAPDSYTFQWIRCDASGTSNCADIPAKTANRYTPGSDDLGHTLRVRVVATNPAGSSDPATSASSGVVHP
jgi:hypothetical protein